MIVGDIVRRLLSPDASANAAAAALIDASKLFALDPTPIPVGSSSTGDAAWAETLAGNVRLDATVGEILFSRVEKRRFLRSLPKT